MYFRIHSEKSLKKEQINFVVHILYSLLTKGIKIHIIQYFAMQINDMGHKEHSLRSTILLLAFYKGALLLNTRAKATRILNYKLYLSR